MAKKRQSFKVRLPIYEGKRLVWRRAISLELAKVAGGIDIRSNDLIELNIKLYMPESAIGKHDVDNRLKAIMDALQGRLGGTKSIKPLNPIVPNDNQIYKVTIEKCISPPQGKGKGHLIVRKYRLNRGS
ncbi:MAG: RusA family crossover junction endodeoxyribonuclease [Candidatus Sumerlaeaceae bacterium]|nr:RusA family crossover junction endodeoxyribonuclease [Candidatus Sumerlaeaceae bacterium]